VAIFPVLSLFTANAEIEESIRISGKYFKVPPSRIFTVDWSSGFGLPTHPPSRHKLVTTVALRVFVPFTAAGQRGLSTPLPLIRPYFLKIPKRAIYNKGKIICQD
jgi:hypothetical protein